MRRVFGPRTVVEAAFLVAVPVTAAALGAGMWPIIGASAVGYLLIVLLEATLGRGRDRGSKTGRSRSWIPSRTALVAAPPQASSVEPSPVEPSPVEPSPVEPSPVEPSPVEPSPVEPSPVEPPTLEPDPVESAVTEPPPPPVEPEPAPDAEPERAGPAPVAPLTKAPQPEPVRVLRPPEPAPAPVVEYPQLVAVPEPEPEPEPEPVSIAPEPEPAPEPSTVVSIGIGAGPRQWNLWDLERLTREHSGGDIAQDEERQFLLMYLREFADPAGLLPLDFDGLVRDSFGELVGAR